MDRTIARMPATTAPAMPSARRTTIRSGLSIPSFQRIIGGRSPRRIGAAVNGRRKDGKCAGANEAQAADSGRFRREGGLCEAYLALSYQLGCWDRAAAVRRGGPRPLFDSR